MCLIWSLKSCICSGTSVHPQKTINQLPWSLHRGLSTFLDTFHSSTFFGFGKKEMNPLLDSIHSLDSYKKESFEQWLNSFQKWEEEGGLLTKCCSTTLLISALILDNVPWEVVLLHVYLKNPTISKSPQHFYQLLKIKEIIFRYYFYVIKCYTFSVCSMYNVIYFWGPLRSPLRTKYAFLIKK